MDTTIQKCDVCNTLNTTGQTGWFRSLGVFSGAPVILAQRPAPNPALKSGGVYPTAKDICPTCAATITFAALVTLHTPPATK